MSFSSFLRLPVLSAAIVLAACGPGEPESRDGADVSMAAAPEWAFSMRAGDLAELVEAGEVTVLHVGRNRESYDEGHIPGAHFAPLSTFAVNRDGQTNVLPEMSTLTTSLQELGVGARRPVVLYGDMGGLAAARGFFALDATGHPRVAVLDGGLDAWLADSLSVTSETPEAPAPGDFIPALNPDRLATAAQVATLLSREDALLVDARPEVQYTGEEPGTDVERPGHIPGAASLYWTEDLTEDGTLRPLAELTARYEAAGATPGAPVVTYCRTGVQASHAYLVARILGLEPALYDGSFMDWSNNTTYPVEAGL